MARWQANPRERLVDAALDLFSEQGYEPTTVIAIAQRAGLTKSTFFRHFPDKREVLFGGEELPVALATAIAAAPAGAAPLDAVGHALDALGRDVFTAERRAFVARRHAVVAANPELQEREALKALDLTAATTAALVRRGVPALTADVAAQLGMLALRRAYERWIAGAETSDATTFATLARRALSQVRTALPSVVRR